MATIGNLVVKVSASLAGFASSMSRASSHILSVGRVADRAAAKMTSYGTALAAAATGGGMVYLIQRQFEAIDATAKLSDQLGIGTRDLVAFDHAAGLSGVAAEDLHKGLQRMVRVLGESKTGFGEGIKGLELLGLSAEEVSGKTPAEAFKMIADAVGRIEDPARRAAAAYAIFGKSGQNLLNVLVGGRSGLEAALAQMDRFGKTFSRDQARAVEEANDAVTDLKGAFAGLATQLAVDMAPVLAFWTRDLTEGVAGTTAKFQDLSKETGAIAEHLTGVQGVMLKLQEIAHGTVVIFKYLKVVVYDVAAKLADWFASFDEWLNGIIRKMKEFFGEEYKPEWDSSIKSRGFAEGLAEYAKRQREEYEKWLAETKTPTERFRLEQERIRRDAATAKAARLQTLAQEENLADVRNLKGLNEQVARATEKALLERIALERELPDWQKQRMEWLKAGASHRIVAEFSRAARAAEEAKAAQEQRKKYEEFLAEQPEEAYRKQMADLRQWVSMGLPARYAERAAAQYARQMLGSSGAGGGAALAPALVRGSAEEISARNRALSGGQDAQRELRDLVRQQLVVLRQEVANSRLMAEGIQRLVLPQVVEIAP